MTTLEINAKVDTNEATKSIDKIVKALDKLTELQEQALTEQTKLNENVDKSSKEASKSLDSATKATSGLAKGFKGVGLAIKAAGIGLVIAALTSLKDVFMQNQEVADAVASTFETVSIVFNEVVGSLVDAVKEVSAATDGFDSLTKVVKGMLTVALTPLKLSFYAISLAVKQAQLAWEESFFGDNNPETIENLKVSIKETSEDIKQVGVDAFEAGKDIVTNYVGAIKELGSVASESMEKVKDISIEAAIEQGKANTELKNNAQLAAAQQSRLIEQYDRQAETLRQVRDLESNTIEERIAANEDLALLLDKQEKSMLKQADLQIAAAQARVNVNNSIENQVALIEALANREGVLAQVQSFRSEQQANINGLTKEANQLTQTQIEGDQERARQLREFAIEQEQDAAKKLELMRENIKEEEDILLEDLERKRELYAEGTQARIDAEEDYLNKKQELSLEEKKLDTDLAKTSVDIEKKKEASKTGLISDGFKLAGDLAKDNAEVQKGIAASEATFNTYSAIVGQLSAFSAIPVPGYAIVQAIATGAFGLANVAKILSTNVGGASSPSIPSSSSPSASVEENTPNIPNFDFINQGVGGNAGSSLNRNYVVLQDIKNQEVVDQRIEELSTLS